MPASCSLYHTVHRQIVRVAADVPVAAQLRLTLLVTGIVAARSCVLRRAAPELAALGLTATDRADSIGRRIRRTLNDPSLTADRCYAALLPLVLPTHPAPGSPPLVLILDESTHTDRVHLLRMSLSYRGGSVPIAWAVWEQNVALPEGGYWAAVDEVLAATAVRVPTGVAIVVVADRAYAVPALLDRLIARGWHWVVRVTTTGSHRWRTAQGSDEGLRDLVAARLAAPGTRMRATGAFAKKAGWRDAALVGVWAAGQAEPLVVLTDLPPRWQVLRLYARRFWIEPGFRLDKRRGWDWEACQVRAVAHHTVLLLALAWASALVICIGAADAAQQRAALAHRPSRRTREHARDSLATRGLAAIRRWLYHPGRYRLIWTLPNLHGPRWNEEWLGAQIHHALFALPVRP